MNENGNLEPQGEAPPPAPPAPPLPPEAPAPSMPSAPVPPAPPLAPGTGPGIGQPKQKLDIPLFILGFFSPIVFLVLSGLLSVALQSDLLVFAVQSLSSLLFVAFIAMFAIGKAKRNRRLWSYGLGGLAAHAVGALLLLLAFGTCLVALSGSAL